MKAVLHRGPIPGTDVGHRWFELKDGHRYGVAGWPHGANEGWSYEVLDSTGRQVEDGFFTLAEIRAWANDYE